MKQHVRFGIRAKFLLLVGLLLMSIFSGIALLLAKQNSTTLKRNLYDEAQSFATLATEPIGGIYVVYKDSGTLNIDSAVKSVIKLDKNISHISIIDTEGLIVYGSAGSAQNKYPATLAESFEAVYINDSNGVLETIIYPYREKTGARRFSVVYTISSASINDSVRRVIVSTILFSVFGLIITLSLIYIFVNIFLIRRIRLISEQTNLISTGHLDQTISVVSNDELGDLAHGINVMAEALKSDIDKLKQLDQAKSEFMMITSHNLRTPLAIIDTYIDSTEYFTTVDEFKNALKEIAHGSKRLGVFAEDVLTISQLEMGEKLQKPTDIRIDEFLKSISTDFAELAKLQEIEFTSELDDGSYTVSISKPYMRAAIWNLLDNALKFTEKGGAIKLSLTKQDQTIDISVADTGTGISSSEIGRLFTKFHRSTDTMIYNFEGSGIGLYATKMIVERHHGHVQVDSTEGIGSTFTITLPYEHADKHESEHVTDDQDAHSPQASKDPSSDTNSVA